MCRNVALGGARCHPGVAVTTGGTCGSIRRGGRRVAAGDARLVEVPGGLRDCLGAPSPRWAADAMKDPR